MGLIFEIRKLLGVGDLTLNAGDEVKVLVNDVQQGATYTVPTFPYESTRINTSRLEQISDINWDNLNETQQDSVMNNAELQVQRKRSA